MATADVKKCSRCHFPNKNKPVPILKDVSVELFQKDIYPKVKIFQFLFSDIRLAPLNAGKRALSSAKKKNADERERERERDTYEAC